MMPMEWHGALKINWIQTKVFQNRLKIIKNRLHIEPFVINEIHI